jgi:hypothetical protein
MAEHLNQGVNAESIDLATSKIADSRLRDAQELRSGGLRQTSCFNQFRQLDHQIRANPKVLRFLRAETQVTEDVARRLANPNCHFSSLLAFSAQNLNLSESFSRERQISLTRLATPLLERVQDVYCLIQLCQIYDSVFRPSVDPNLECARANRRKRFVIVGRKAALDPSQLIARSPAGISRKRTNGVQRRTDPDEGLISHGSNISTRVYTVKGRLTPHSADGRCRHAACGARGAPARRGGGRGRS